MNKRRYEKLDGIRGLALLNMIAYHTAWDLVYIYQVNWEWYKSRGAYVWQQGICWTFIFLSGFCLPMGRHTLRRGITIFLGGAVITLATVAAMPQNKVVFGILTLIGSCMLIIHILRKLLDSLSPVAGLAWSAVLFFLTRDINEGYLGFERCRLFEATPQLYEKLYGNLFTTYLGFPYKEFYSTDYFPIIPWIFLYTMGYFAFCVLNKKKALGFLEKGLSKPLEWLGGHSFEIYMVHQPVIYFLLEILF